MNKQVILLALIFAVVNLLQAQTTEELQAEKTQKEAELATKKGELDALTGEVKTLEAEVNALTDQLTPYPRWDVGTLGTVGLNFSQFNDWLSKDKPNTSAANIGLALNAFAHLQQEKYFWRNNASLTLGWIKFDDKSTSMDNDEFEVSADAFNINSLLGFKMGEKIAISVLGDYRTSILDSRFNNPGYLDIGAGITWTPATDLVVVIHPLNYNFVFSDSDFDYQSSIGAKIVADYIKKFPGGVTWKSNFSTFLSYKDLSNLSNWIFTNGVSLKVGKNIGVGFELGFRGNKQEALDYELNRKIPLNPNATFDSVDNPLQTYWILGVTYSI